MKSSNVPFGLYWWLAIIYALVSSTTGPVLVLLSLVLMGIPLLLHLAFLVLAAVVACHVGSLSRQSFRHALLVGLPCVLAYAVQCPVVTAKDAMGLPVPWMWEKSSSFDQVFPQFMTAMGVALALATVGFLFSSARESGRGDNARKAPMRPGQGNTRHESTLAELMRRKNGK